MRALLAIGLLSVFGFSLAQHSPYAGQQDRQIKGLSAQEIEQYRAGAGMGYAKAAELNHFPGPMHVLELADKLALSAEQKVATQRLMETHKAEARMLGAKLVEAERALEALFRSRGVSESVLAEAVRSAASLQGQYRLSHLETHRRMRALLTEQQVVLYDDLRGYSAEKMHKH
jgi:hypothetical protein